MVAGEHGGQFCFDFFCGDVAEGLVEGPAVSGGVEYFAGADAPECVLYWCVDGGSGCDGSGECGVGVGDGESVGGW